jgi:hypothetical protein
MWIPAITALLSQMPLTLLPSLCPLLAAAGARSRLPSSSSPTLTMRTTRRTTWIAVSSKAASLRSFSPSRSASPLARCVTAMAPPRAGKHAFLCAQSPDVAPLPAPCPPLALLVSSHRRTALVCCAVYQHGNLGWRRAYGRRKRALTAHCILVSVSAPAVPA